MFTLIFYIISGKLQVLDILLQRLKTELHRVLIFTQMTKMLNILEAFLNYHGHRYLRLDGTTKVEQRQFLMDRFNADKRIFVFILSTRSGGIGVNLTGADTVIFYDSDWNPTMDAQAQDRCHRIGQTRDVHIYRYKLASYDLSEKEKQKVIYKIDNTNFRKIGINLVLIKCSHKLSILLYIVAYMYIYLNKFMEMYHTCQLHMK